MVPSLAASAPRASSTRHNRGALEMPLCCWWQPLRKVSGEDATKADGKKGQWSDRPCQSGLGGPLELGVVARSRVVWLGSPLFPPPGAARPSALERMTGALAARDWRRRSRGSWRSRASASRRRQPSARERSTPPRCATKFRAGHAPAGERLHPDREPCFSVALMPHVVKLHLSARDSSALTESCSITPLRGRRRRRQGAVFRASSGEHVGFLAMLGARY